MGAPQIEKRCGRCQAVKFVDEFYRARKGRDGFCKACRRVMDLERSARRSEVTLKAKLADPLVFRRRKLLSLYGITHEQWMEMYDRQGGVCAICGLAEKRMLYGAVAHLVVDHDHATGVVRSLLCHRCNTSLGIVEDGFFLEAALAYLAEHRRTSA